MPVTLDYSVRSYGGGAAPTTITQTITSVATNILLADTTTWLEVNTGSKLTTSGYIVIAIDYGLSTEEKVLCTGLTGNGTSQTITALLRGYDGTTAQSHSSGATVAVVASSAELAEANKAAASTLYLNTSPGSDPSFPGLIEWGSTTSASTNGTVTTAASSDHKHFLPQSLVTDLINQTYVQSRQKNTSAARSGGSGGTNVTLPNTAPASSVITNTTTSVAITGVTKVMWVAKFQWHGATTANANEVLANLYGSTNSGSTWTNLDSASAGYMPAVASANTVVTFVATSVYAGLTATNTYVFALNGSASSTGGSTDRDHFNRFNLSVIGIP